MIRPCTPSRTHRVRRGPLAALLIFLSLFLGSGTAAAGGAEIRGTAARLSPSRAGAPSAVILPGARTQLDDEAAGAEGGSPLPPRPPAIVTKSLWARPPHSPGGGSPSLLPQAAKAAYRARAPPAP